ncbi:MAG: hypothetical protein AB8I08_09050 [Sandaracinaceae bacterium]
MASPPVESAGREVLAFVEAVGPGGAVVATSGSPDAPHPSPRPAAEPEPAEDHDDGWVPEELEEGSSSAADVAAGGRPRG